MLTPIGQAKVWLLKFSQQVIDMEVIIGARVRVPDPLELVERVKHILAFERFVLTWEE